MLLATLAELGIVLPTAPPNAEGMPQSMQQEFERFHTIAAQAIYKLPTVWPRWRDFAVRINNSDDFEHERVLGVSSPCDALLETPDRFLLL